MNHDPVHVDIPARPPLTCRTNWYGVADAEHANRSFGHLRDVYAQIATAQALYPCVLRMHATDAYELAADERFKPTHGVGQILGRVLGMAVILDPEGIEGEVELEICSGCRSFDSWCDYRQEAA